MEAGINLLAGLAIALVAMIGGASALRRTHGLVGQGQAIRVPVRGPAPRAGGQSTTLPIPRDPLDPAQRFRPRENRT